MEAIEFPQVNLRIAEDQPEYKTLPVYTQRGIEGCVVSCWQMSQEEIEKVKETGKIWLHVLTFGNDLQPLLMSVDSPFVEQVQQPKVKTGIELIAEERREQIEKHGWTLWRDQYYGAGQLIQAAQFCEEQALNKRTGRTIELYKWPTGWDTYFEAKIRNKSVIGMLTVAGAFYMAENDIMNTSAAYNQQVLKIAAEIDRLQNQQ